jgi:hypothetical protein
MNNNQNILVEASQLENKRIGYGDNFNLHLLEQYKLCVEMADRISTRRSQANSFYISLLSAIPALLTFISDKQFLSQPRSVLLLFMSILGLTSCYVWYSNIQSYKQLNSAKFNVINEIEVFLPFPCFSREWEVLTSDKFKRKEYKPLTVVEKVIPLIFAFSYFGLFIYSFFSILGFAK